MLNEQVEYRVQVDRVCPECGGDPVLLGNLFETVWARCRDCGWEFQAGRLVRVPVDEDESE